MAQQHGSLNEVDSFLEDVTQQIQYKPIRQEIKEELSAHIYSPLIIIIIIELLTGF